MFFCRKNHDLIIEHDHDPDQGDGKRPTIYNIRGLACKRCNWHLGLYEADKRGSYRAWDHVDPIINSREYEDYIYAYADRLRCLHEKFLEGTCPNYWSRRVVIDKFDEWNEEGGDYPWNWGFKEIKDKRHGRVRTPMQFHRTLNACMKFVMEEAKKDPNYQPPEKFIEILVRIKPLMDSAIEARRSSEQGKSHHPD